MKYRVEYSITGAESGGNSSKTFDADNDIDAAQKAEALIAEAEHECNKKIDNQFWHFHYKRTKLTKILQEEISELVPEATISMIKPAPRCPIVCRPVRDPYDVEI